LNILAALCLVQWYTPSAPKDISTDVPRFWNTYAVGSWCPYVYYALERFVDFILQDWRSRWACKDHQEAILQMLAFAIEYGGSWLLATIVSLGGLFSSVTFIDFSLRQSLHQPMDDLGSSSLKIALVLSQYYRTSKTSVTSGQRSSYST
jgi:hypothetical protein